MPKIRNESKWSKIICPWCKGEFEIRNIYLERKQVHCCSKSCAYYYRLNNPEDILGNQPRPGRTRVHPIKVKVRKIRKPLESHGHAVGGKTSPTYQSWRAMKQRCYCPKNKDWDSYGGRGIVVMEEWNKSFSKFLEDMGERPSKEYSLDRVDPDKNYGPDNCQWILKAENSRKGNAQRRERAGKEQGVRADN